MEPKTFILVEQSFHQMNLNKVFILSLSLKSNHFFHTDSTDSIGVNREHYSYNVFSTFHFLTKELLIVAYSEV